MAPFVPLQLIDDLLRPYNVGQAVLLLFLLVIVGVLPLRSRKVLSLNILLFGVLFLLLPQSMAPFHYSLLGIGLIVLGPILYVTGRR
ncbi:MAG: hypothetical protein ABEJ68_05105 [Halobacteriaceae archaeon]